MKINPLLNYDLKYSKNSKCQKLEIKNEEKHKILNSTGVRY
jgi:hypothetical protein